MMVEIGKIIAQLMVKILLILMNIGCRQRVGATCSRAYCRGNGFLINNDSHAIPASTALDKIQVFRIIQ